MKKLKNRKSTLFIPSKLKTCAYQRFPALESQKPLFFQKEIMSSFLIENFIVITIEVQDNSSVLQKKIRGVPDNKK